LLVALYVLIAYALVYAPKYAVTLALLVAKNYDNRNPRDQQARLEGWKKRAVAAHTNGFESFMAFAAGAILAHLGHVDPFWQNALSITYLSTRALYPFAYMGDIHWLRSTIWTFSILCSLGLMFLAFLGKP
jgi:uncharacterized MAPEG superfamily protein